MHPQRLGRDCRGGAKFGSLGTVPYLSDLKSAGGLRPNYSIVYSANTMSAVLDAGGIVMAGNA